MNQEAEPTIKHIPLVVCRERAGKNAGFADVVTPFAIACPRYTIDTIQAHHDLLPIAVRLVTGVPQSGIESSSRPLTGGEPSK